MQSFPRELFHHFRDMHYVVLAVASPEHHVLLEAESNRELWQLIGGQIRSGDGIEDTIDRLITERTGLEIEQVTPLALTINRYTSGPMRVEHSGIAFLVSCQGQVTPRTGRRLQFTATPTRNLAYRTDEDVMAKAFQTLRTLEIPPPFEEIEEGRRQTKKTMSPLRLLAKSVDSVIARPIGYLGSSRILRQKVIDLVGDSDTVLDTACGDDALVLKLAGKAELCVANDISWSVMSKLRNNAKAPNIIFTNGNLLAPRFRSQFDVVICKNVLHHMRTREELVDATEQLGALGRRLLLIDIEHPKRSLRRAKWWNAYYRQLHGDHGEYFLTRHDFESLVFVSYPGAIVSFDYVKTIKGIYMFAAVDFPDSRRTTDSSVKPYTKRLRGVTPDPSILPASLDQN